jgi:hypothetical protein
VGWKKGVFVHFRTLADGYPQQAQVCFWMWRDRLPIFHKEITLSAFRNDLSGALNSAGSSRFKRIENIEFASCGGWCLGEWRGWNTNHNVCRECGFCYGACQSWMFPSLFQFISIYSSSRCSLRRRIKRRDPRWAF